MLNTKEYFNQLDATLAVNEIDNETAAAIQGGASLRVFNYGTNPRQQLGEFNYGKVDQVSKSADKISPLQILANKVWRFYADKNFQGANAAFSRKDMKNGKIELPASLNNKVSSFQEVGTI